MSIPINTWTYDGQTWTMESPATQPPLVYASSAVFDPNLNTVILFGGGSGGIDQNTTWSWTGSNWEQLFPRAITRARAKAPASPLIGTSAAPSSLADKTAKCGVGRYAGS